jgi:hypothetical protein
MSNSREVTKRLHAIQESNLKDQFASEAMQSMIQMMEPGDTIKMSALAASAYAMAKAMIKQRDVELKNNIAR